jgi:hypothetical protein
MVCSAGQLRRRKLCRFSGTARRGLKPTSQADTINNIEFLLKWLNSDEQAVVDIKGTKCAGSGRYY